MQPKHIIIVDDTPENLHVLSALLHRKGYAVSAFPNGKMALAAAMRRPPDLILLDINMPEMNGFEVCSAFKAESVIRDIPIIFISALDDLENKVRALRSGGVDYITKPFQMDEVYVRVDTHLRLREAQAVLEQFNQELKTQVAQQVEELNKSQLAMIFALAKLSHTRDDDTGLHLERVQHLCKMLATALSASPPFADVITPDFIDTIYHSSPLHDVGKVGIVDSILLKPGRLTEDEFAIMKTHTTIGAATLESVLKQSPNNAFVEMGIEIAKYHHEKWDGSGYPMGLSGNAIPLSARIMALVDVYEALRSRRPYKEPFPHEESCEILRGGSAKSFDPRIVDVFQQIEKDFKAVHSHLLDQ